MWRIPLRGRKAELQDLTKSEREDIGSKKKQFEARHFCLPTPSLPISTAIIVIAHFLI
jgi:hypothetical protein